MIFVYTVLFIYVFSILGFRKVQGYLYEFRREGLQKTLMPYNPKYILWISSFVPLLNTILMLVDLPRFIRKKRAMKRGNRRLKVLAKKYKHIPEIQQLSEDFNKLVQYLDKEDLTREDID